jgi:hypothetical protein
MLRFGDRCYLEVTCRLCQHAAVQRGKGPEQNVGLDQKNALHVRTCADSGMARDLPEDVLRKCAIRQEHIVVRGLHEVTRDLNDEDVGVAPRPEPSK